MVSAAKRLHHQRSAQPAARAALMARVARFRDHHIEMSRVGDGGNDATPNTEGGVAVIRRLDYVRKLEGDGAGDVNRDHDVILARRTERSAPQVEFVRRQRFHAQI